MCQRKANDPPLQFAMKGYTKVMAHHKRKENRSWRFAVLGYVKSHAQRDCRNPSAFNSALNQRDGLMSYWSSRTQQHGIGSIRDHGIGNVFCQSSLERGRIHLIADEGKEVWR